MMRALTRDAKIAIAIFIASLIMMAVLGYIGYDRWSP